MRNDTSWSTLTPQQKRSRVIMQLNKIEDKAVFDAREGGPCTSGCRGEVDAGEG